jgi:hypothetical protein
MRRRLTSASLSSHVSGAARGEIGKGDMADAEAAAVGGGKQGCGVHAAALTKSALHGGCHADSVLFDDAGACRGLCLRGMRAGVYVHMFSVFSMRAWSRCVGVLVCAVCAFVLGILSYFPTYLFFCCSASCRCRCSLASVFYILVLSIFLVCIVSLVGLLCVSCSLARVVHPSQCFAAIVRGAPTLLQEHVCGIGDAWRML